MADEDARHKIDIGIDKHGTITRTQSQNVQPILDQAKREREAQRFSRKDIQKVASIPTTLIQKLIDDGKLGKDYFQDKAQKARLMQIIQREYPGFLSTHKKITMKGF